MKLHFSPQKFDAKIIIPYFSRTEYFPYLAKVVTVELKVAPTRIFQNQLIGLNFDIARRSRSSEPQPIDPDNQPR